MPVVTARQAGELARDAGARRVYIASAAPAIRHPNVYGIDMPTPDEFIAHNRDEGEVAESIGADWLIYQQIEDLVESAQQGNPDITEFDCSVFDGHYVTGDIDVGYLESLSLRRSDKMKQRRDADLNPDQSVIELHNHA